MFPVNDARNSLGLVRSFEGDRPIHVDLIWLPSCSLPSWFAFPNGQIFPMCSDFAAPLRSRKVEKEYGEKSDEFCDALLELAECAGKMKVAVAQHPDHLQGS